MTARIIHGDCKEVLKTMEADSMGAMVTDPPAGIAFMGKAWDSFESCLHLFGTGMPKGLNVAKAGAGDAWEGWNTTLKPSHEVWWLVRKPLSEKTVVAQVLATGTGAINVDGCRVGTSKEVPGSPLSRKKGISLSGSVDGSLRKETGAEGGHNPNIGRWPANAVLSHSPECKEDSCVEGCPVKALDEQSGFLKSGNSTNSCIERPQGKEGTTYSGREWMGKKLSGEHYSDSGGVSRFFYTSKVPASERTLPDGTTNNHPTAKSVKLMRYFVKLVTPQGGTVLDPFAGSGTTGVAALQENMNFVGIELDPEHHRVAELRIEAENAYKNSIDLHLTLPED